MSDGGWATLDEYNANRKQKKTITDFSENDRVNAGHLYLTTDKGERKSSGSYYTPDYIVNYIVKNTIGPVVEQKWKDAQEKGESCIDATLSINVLDPAMGSGHFLVGAVDFLSQKLLEAVQKDFEAGKIADTAPYTNDWARRDVVSHCIYGVDLNELAVELAKVGLWLTTISRDKPLSFLDHRSEAGEQSDRGTAYQPPVLSGKGTKGEKSDRTADLHITQVYRTYSRQDRRTRRYRGQPTGRYHSEGESV